MANYTCELYYILATMAHAADVDGANMEEVIETARPIIFNFPYAVHAAWPKEQMETRFLAHYIDREICFDAVPRWLFYFKYRWLQEIDYYDQLFQSTLLKFNPLEDYNLTKVGGKNRTEGTKEDGTFNQSQSGQLQSNAQQDTVTDTSSTSVGENSDAYSDTPQSGLKDVRDLKYLTHANIRANDDTSTGKTQDHQSGKSDQTSSGTIGSQSNLNRNLTGNENYNEMLSGKIGSTSYAKMLMEYRETIHNYEEEFIESLQDLFIFFLD